VQAVEVYHRRALYVPDLPEEDHKKRVEEILDSAPAEHDASGGRSSVFPPAMSPLAATPGHIPNTPVSKPFPICGLLLALLAHAINAPFRHATCDRVTAGGPDGADERGQRLIDSGSSRCSPPG
jgi:hypothetical protein